jgi:nucleotide-binding universal stress UspA family protein
MVPDRPLLLCYDGSEDAKHAISEAATLLGPRPALVLTVWQHAAAIPAFAWAAPLPDLDDLLSAAREGARRVADEGVEAARSAGFTATPLVVESGVPVWLAVVEAADAHDVAAVVMGSRGLSGVKSALMGSVSNGVVHHTTRPVLVVRRTDA